MVIAVAEGAGQEHVATGEKEVFFPKGLCSFGVLKWTLKNMLLD